MEWCASAETRLAMLNYFLSKRPFLVLKCACQFVSYQRKGREGGGGMCTLPEIHTMKFAFHKPLNSTKNFLTVYFTAVFFFMMQVFRDVTLCRRIGIFRRQTVTSQKILHPSRGSY
jgi:hypothetical protein